MTTEKGKYPDGLDRAWSRARRARILQAACGFAAFVCLIRAAGFEDVWTLVALGLFVGCLLCGHYAKSVMKPYVDEPVRIRSRKPNGWDYIGVASSAMFFVSAVLFNMDDGLSQVPTITACLGLLINFVAFYQRVLKPRKGRRELDKLDTSRDT